MGHKTDARAVRLGINRSFDANWIAKNDKEYVEYLHEDNQIRGYLDKKLRKADVARTIINRTSPKRVEVQVYTYKVGLILGRKGSSADQIKKSLESLTNREVIFKVLEMPMSKLSAKVLGEQIAQSIEKRTPFKKAMNYALMRARKAGVKGVKIAIGGRLNGAEIARTETVLQGKVPLHSFNYDVDYAPISAHTIYGVVGIKVWISYGIKRGVSDVNA